MNKQELNKLIGKNVKKYRLLYNTKNKNKMTQAKLSEMLGVHMSLIAALESSNLFSMSCNCIFNTVVLAHFKQLIRRCIFIF